MNMTAAKRGFSLLFTDSCTVYAYDAVKRSDGSTGRELKTVYEDLPCRISFDNIKRVYQTSSVGHTMQTVRLFLLPEPEIDPGSVITVTRAGRQYRYKNSGIPAMYETHQEILLEPVKTGA